MLGCITPHNNVYIFFEGDEISRLEKETITGEYVNLLPSNSVVQLKTSIRNNIKESAKISNNKDLCGVLKKCSLSIKKEVYEILNENGKYNSREGFFNIFLININKGDSHDRYIYDQLCYNRSKYSKIKAPKSRGLEEIGFLQ